MKKLLTGVFLLLSSGIGVCQVYECVNTISGTVSGFDDWDEAMDLYISMRTGLGNKWNFHTEVFTMNDYGFMDGYYTYYMVKTRKYVKLHVGDGQYTDNIYEVTVFYIAGRYPKGIKYIIKDAKKYPEDYRVSYSEKKGM